MPATAVKPEILSVTSPEGDERKKSSKKTSSKRKSKTKSKKKKPSRRRRRNKTEFRKAVKSAFKRTKNFDASGMKFSSSVDKHHIDGEKGSQNVYIKSGDKHIPIGAAGIASDGSLIGKRSKNYNSKSGKKSRSRLWEKEVGIHVKLPEGMYQCYRNREFGLSPDWLKKTLAKIVSLKEIGLDIDAQLDDLLIQNELIDKPGDIPDDFEVA